MALTRKSLTAMGLTAEQVDSIIEMHAETVDGLKDQLKTAQEQVGKLEGLQKELDDLKADGTDYKSKFEKEHKDFEAYKKEIESKSAYQAQESAVKAYFESKGITGQNLEIAMRGAKDEIKSAALDGEKIKDTKPLDALIDGAYKVLVGKDVKIGASLANPPANSGSVYKTKAEIMAIKDTAQRQAEIAKNHELFGF